MLEHYLEDCKEKVRIFGVLRYFDVFRREIRERREKENLPRTFFFLFFGFKMRGMGYLYRKSHPLAAGTPSRVAGHPVEVSNSSPS